MSKTNYAVPTGSYLDEWLEENHMTRTELAARLGASRKHVSQLVSGKVPLSYEVAEDLALVTGVPARVWNNYEALYRADLARLRKDAVLAGRFEEVSSFPIGYLRRSGHITAKSSDRAGVVRQLLEFFNVAEVDSLLAYATQSLAAYRQSQAFDVDDYAVAAWIRSGIHQAAERQVPDYDENALRSALQQLRDLTDSVDFGPRIIDILAEAGVVVLFDSGPPGTRCSGVTHWDGPTPIVQLTDRGKTNDKFWFTLFHELAHVLLHPRRRVFVEGAQEEGNRDAAEVEADLFARDALISPEDWLRCPRTRSLDEIRRYAHAIGIHPAIVVGRMQFELKQYAWGNGLKQSVRIVEERR